MPGTVQAPVAVVVLHTLAAPRDPELVAVIGARRMNALVEALELRARRWAARVGPDRAYEANSIGATGAALHRHDGPVLLIAPDVPSLHVDAAGLALADLADGAMVVIGPSTDGSPFLVGVPSADEAALELAGAPLDRLMGDPRMQTAGVGMLRSERRLVTLADAHAYAADPLADPELLAHLEPVIGRGRPSVQPS